MRMILLLAGIASGLYFIIADRLKIPYLKSSKAIMNMGRSDRKLTKSLDVVIMDLSMKLAKVIPMDRYNENIRFLLNQFIHCSAYENIVFCRVMHERTIIDTIISGIDTSSCIVEKISLICDENALKSRLKNDISAGLRKPDVVERSIERLPLYSFFGTRIIDTTKKRVEETTTEIAGI